MANTFKFGNGNWAVKDGYALAYNDENNNFKPLPFDFTRASSATTLNRQGLIETVGNGKPRIDFTDNTDGHLLLEPSRMNKLVRSNKFNTTWTLGSALSLTSGQTSTLTGNSDAWLLSNNGTSGFSALTQAVSISGSHTYSIFAKKGTNNLISLRSLSGLDARAEFNLNTGVLNSTSNTSSTEIKSYGNGWYRISMTFSASNSFVYVYPNSIGTADAGNIYIQNAQLEAGSYATSYIPTEGSSVTRVLDEADQTGVQQVIGQTEGTLYLEFVPLDASALQILFQIRTTGYTNVGQVDIRFQSSQIRALGSDTNGTTQFNILGGSITAGNTYKAAIRYKTNDAKFYINGSSVGTDTSCSFTSSTKAQISFNENVGANFPALAKIKDARLYNTALTDTELQNLTS